jgi:hypothetical protein
MSFGGAFFFLRGERVGMAKEWLCMVNDATSGDRTHNSQCKSVQGSEKATNRHKHLFMSVG